jgi:hypothetical protein
MIGGILDLAIVLLSQAKSESDQWRRWGLVQDARRELDELTPWLAARSVPPIE